MAAEEPQIKVAPDMIIEVCLSISNQRQPIKATTINKVGVSNQLTNKARGANGFNTEMSIHRRTKLMAMYSSVCWAILIQGGNGWLSPFCQKVKRFLKRQPKIIAQMEAPKLAL